MSPRQSLREIGNFWWQIMIFEERCLNKITQIAFPPSAMEPKVTGSDFAEHLGNFLRGILCEFSASSQKTHMKVISVQCHELM